VAASSGGGGDGGPPWPLLVFAGVAVVVGSVLVFRRSPTSGLGRV
jgi:hypothetical protein